MATASTTPITYLPPGEAHGAHHSEWPRLKSFNTVSAHVVAGGEIASNGISWDDFGRMQTNVQKLNSGRKYETPAWVMDDRSLRAVIVRYVELRARFRTTQPGNDAERLQRAETKLNSYTPQIEAQLTRLCKEHLALKRAGGNAAYIRKLTEEIENLDTVLRVNKSIAGIVLRLATLYWKQGYSSPECASELSLKPPHCRVLLMRLCCIAKQLGLTNVPSGKRDNIKRTQTYCTKCGTRRGRNRRCEACGVKCPAVTAGGLARIVATKKKRKPADTNSPDAIRRRKQMAAGLCGKSGCKNKRWEDRAECQHHTLLYRALAHAWQKKKRAIARVTAAGQIRTGASA